VLHAASLESYASLLQVIDRGQPDECYHLRGDYSKARRQLGWRPTVGFHAVVHMMVDEEMVAVGALCEGVNVVQCGEGYGPCAPLAESALPTVLSSIPWRCGT
jgi:GDP-D-mannose dehydratase